jgi:prepilin-type N-terminal cleavage/methylation domain-containing protein
MTRLQRGRDDAGFSLPELLVVMMLSSIVLAAVAVVFNGSMRVARAAIAKGSTTADARIAMDAMLRRLRVTVAPLDGTNAFGMAGTVAGTNYPTGVDPVPSATEVAFFASITTAGSPADPAPTLVDYSIDTAAKCLREKLTPASGAAPPFTWPAANTRSRCLVFGVLNTDGSRLFTYYADGKTSTALTVTLAADNAKSIDSVGINVSIAGATTPDVPPTKLAGRVTLTSVAGDDLVGGA